MRTAILKVLPVALVLLALIACQPETVEVTRVVTETSVEEVEVTRVVEGETITEVQEVEVEVEVTREVVVTEEVEVEVEVPTEFTNIRVNMGYIPDVQYAPFYVGIEQGYFAQEGLNLVVDYSTEVDGIELLAAGEAQFATGSGDLLVQARGQGLPIQFVLRWYNGIPSAIVSLKESGIESPADLVGKTVGIPGFFGINYKSYLSMLAANDLSSEDVQLEAIGWTQVASVSEGLVDAAVVYSNNEPIQMIWGGSEVNIMELKEFNNFVPIGIMTSETLIQENPELVQGFVRAFLKSVKATLDDPEFALDAAMRAVGVFGWERAKAEMALGKSLEFWAVDDDQYGYFEVDTFDWTQDFLIAAGEMDNEIDTSLCFTNEFVANAQP
jgi:NitT/TauT family transport system substrate-binding protein